MIDQLPDAHAQQGGGSGDVASRSLRPTIRPEDLQRAVGALRDLLDDADVPVLVLTGAGLDPAAASALLSALEDTGLLGLLLGADQQVRPISAGAAHDSSRLGHLAELLAGEDADQSAARSLENTATSPSPVASRSSGVRPLADADPERFRVLLGAYRALLVASLEQRAYRISRDLRPGLLALAADLAELGADPRDCVQLQTRTLRDFARTEDKALVDVARDEGMVLLVELLGYLARAYRDGRHRPQARSVRAAE